MTPELMIALGDELYTALARCQVVEPLTSRHADVTLDDAYGIQQQLNARRLAKGERIVGKKIGVTSQAVMNMLGVGQPDFGMLTDAMRLGRHLASRRSATAFAARAADAGTSPRRSAF